MKIAILTTNFPRWAGDFRVPFIIDAARALQSKGHTIRIITPHQPGSAKHESIDGLEIIRVQYLSERFEVLQADAAGIPAAWEKGFLYKLSLIPFFLALCYSAGKYAKGFDIIHANWSLAGLAAYLSRPFHHCPYIVTIHGSDIFKTTGNFFLQLPVKIALKNARNVIAVSEAISKACQEIGVSSDRIQVIPTGIDIQKFPYGDPDHRENRLLYVGSLIKRKGVIYLLKAMKKVKEEWPDYKLLIVGEGVLREELETYVHKNDLTNHVSFLGTKSQSDVASLMRQSKLFILPSTEEGQGAVLIEAMASGTPCIGSKTGGIQHVITEDVGKLFIPADSESLLDAITLMIENEAFWKTASQIARTRAVNLYSWNLLSEKIIDIYKNIVNDID